MSGKRSLTVYTSRLSARKEREIGKLLYPLDEHDDIERPMVRGDCKGGARPCPWVSCKYHLYLDVKPKTGSITLNFPGKDVDEIPETCALDIADRGGEILEVVGTCMNLTRERVRQIEEKTLHRAALLNPKSRVHVEEK